MIPRSKAIASKTKQTMRGFLLSLLVQTYPFSNCLTRGSRVAFRCLVRAPWELNGARGARVIRLWISHCDMPFLTATNRRTPEIPQWRCHAFQVNQRMEPLSDRDAFEGIFQKAPTQHVDVVSEQRACFVLGIPRPFSGWGCQMEATLFLVVLSLEKSPDS